jgi:hypothetical protein
MRSEELQKHLAKIIEVQRKMQEAAKAAGKETKQEEETEASK